MKRYVAILLSMLLLMTSVPVVAADAQAPALPEGPCFVVSYEEAKVGETVDVKISVIHNPGIVSAKVKVHFDTTVLQLVSCADGEFSADGYSYGSVDSANVKGYFIINWCDAVAPDSVAEWLATLTFEVLEGAAYGPSALNVTFSCEDDVYNYDFDVVEFESVAGQVYVLYPVTGVTLEYAALNMFNGDSFTLSADVLAEGKADTAVTWSSDNTDVITVDADGNVTAVGLGNANVTVTTVDGGYTATCAITVACAHRDTAETVVGKAPTCTETGLTDGSTCADCGEILTAQQEIPALGHDYEGVVTAPTCENDGYTTYTCANCGDSYVDDEVAALGHNHELTEDVAPTCENDGYKVYTCTACGDSYTETISAIGHDYQGVVTAPTCENGGYTTYTCANCGDSYVDDEVAALGHNHELTEDVAPTCENDGYKVYTCTVCGDSYTETISAIGHDYEGVVTAPDCENGGYTTYTCANCGDSYVTDEVAALGHNHELTEDVAPTCENDGYKVYTCTACGDSYTETISAIGHDYQGVVTAPTCENDGYTTYTCANCGDAYVTDETAALGHSEIAIPGKDATCTEDGLTEGVQCAVCGAVLVAQQVIVGEHLPWDYDIRPTCTEPGYAAVTRCLKCDEILYPGDEIPALGHKYVLTEEIAPTCIADGKNTYTCSACSDSYSDILPALGHTAEAVAGTAPTCTADGLTDGEKCAVCDEILTAQQIIPAFGHAYDDDYDAECNHCGFIRDALCRHEYAVEEIAPTCIENGLKTYTCQHCGESYTETIPATGHTAEAVTGYAPTCEAEGLTDGEQCATCGKILVAQAAIPALGHSYALTEEIAPTCIATGKNVYTCSACSDSYSDILPALGHTAAAVVGTAPTCTADGLTDGEKCAVCDEILTAQQVIPAFGHAYDDDYDAECNHCGFIRDALCRHEYAVEETAPTCIENGLKTYTCQHCGESYTETIPAIGHTAEAVLGYAPTCEVDGLTDGEQCATCGKILVAQEVIPATGHMYITPPFSGIEPTCTTEGTKQRVCLYCEHTYTEIVPAKGHNPVTVPGVDATCTTDGYMEGERCSRCDETLVPSLTIPAFGHDMYLSHEVLPTCTEGGEQTFSCTRCGPLEIISTPPLGHVYDNDRDADCNECGAIREVAGKPGDANGDNKINNRDLGLLQKYLNGTAVDMDVEAMDVNDDGKVNNRDLGLLQKYLNGSDVVLK